MKIVQHMYIFGYWLIFDSMYLFYINLDIIYTDYISQED